MIISGLSGVDRLASSPSASGLISVGPERPLAQLASFSASDLYELGSSSKAPMYAAKIASAFSDTPSSTWSKTLTNPSAKICHRKQSLSGL